MQCITCGGQNQVETKKCGYCGSDMRSSDQTHQPKNSGALLGISINTPNTAADEKWSGLTIKPEHGESEGRDITAGLDQYYKDAFKVFESTSPPKFAPNFNWAAFLFGPFWYFYHGMWAKGLLYLVFNIVVIEAPFLWVIPWIYASLFGTYDFFILRKFDKQLW